MGLGASSGACFAEDSDEGFEDDFDVEPDGEVSNVLHVKFYYFVEVFDVAAA